MGILDMLNPAAALMHKMSGQNNMMGHISQALGVHPSGQPMEQMGGAASEQPGFAAPRQPEMMGGGYSPGAAPVPDVAGWTPDQERQARAHGFPSAQAAVDWERHRQERRPQQTVSGQSTEGDNVRGGQVVHPGGGNAMSWHPASLFNWVASIMHGANNPQQ